MDRITTAQQIKDILEPIPADKFQRNYYGYNYKSSNNGAEDNGCSCALGHIHRHFDPKSKRAIGDSNGYGARQLTKDYLYVKHKLETDISGINNFDKYNGYTEPKIKDRVMHLVNDMIKDGY